jgi:GGDEF domain-containing protein
VRNITAEKESHDKIEKLAYTDFPTQLLNRIAIERQLLDFMSQTQAGQSIGILVLSKDIASINKVYGSGIGDAFLKEVARQLLDRPKLGGLGQAWRWRFCLHHEKQWQGGAGGFCKELA